MEVSWDVGSIWILKSWDKTSVLRVLIGPIVGEVRRSTCCLLTAPSGAPSRASISVVQNVITTSSHVVDDSISIDTNTSLSTGLDHRPQILSASASSCEFVRSWLVVEPPWVELTILGPLITEGRFGHWEYLHSHPSLLSQVLALFAHIIMWPAEHLNDSSLLAAFVSI